MAGPFEKDCMTEIVRNRTIRPSSRLEKSKSYKVDTKQISRGDILIVNIDHESKSFHKTYRFNGTDIADKDSISFRVNDFGISIDISWSGAQPIGTTSNSTEIIRPGVRTKTADQRQVIKALNLKTSFDPISNSETTILILGTMPGDKSILLGEYYGHPRNRFWKIISRITKNETPLTYSEKKTLLIKTSIGIWDVAHKAHREGSLDSAIEDEEPNDLETFISRHSNLRVIGFNGTKAESLFDRYFSRKPNLKYLLLPSTSPANTGMDFADICKEWTRIIEE